ncbi:unnamed protein product [Ranitomeya imitator]|uniref:Uncharacterized protein n=1 Tax=Ranitomeya imitator TaxID=111125 RepID=A0ABN9MH99_9NEOB|nr:unnamed protein product [Ranitomeya imitator]
MLEVCEQLGVRKFLLTTPLHMDAEDTGVCQLHALEEEAASAGFGVTAGLEPTNLHVISSDQLPPENLSAAINQKITSPNRIFSDENHYASIVVGFPDLMSPSEVYSWNRKHPLGNQAGSSSDHFFQPTKFANIKRTNCVNLLEANQVVRAVSAADVPLKEIYPKVTARGPGTRSGTQRWNETGDYSKCRGPELVATPAPEAHSVPVSPPAQAPQHSAPNDDRASSASPYTSWLSKITDSDILVATLGSKGVVTVDMGGSVRLWETGLESIQRSLLEWRNMIGQEDGRPVQAPSHIATLQRYRQLSGSLQRRCLIAGELSHRQLSSDQRSRDPR